MGAQIAEALWRWHYSVCRSMWEEAELTPVKSVVRPESCEIFLLRSGTLGKLWPFWCFPMFVMQVGVGRPLLYQPRAKVHVSDTQISRGWKGPLWVI